jgi:hypothetical protein
MHLTIIISLTEIILYSLILIPQFFFSNHFIKFLNNQLETLNHLLFKLTNKLRLINFKFLILNFH